MARRRRNGRKADIISKIFKGIYRIGSKLLISGPVLVPGAAAVKDALAGGRDPINVFVYEAAGFSTASGQLDQEKLKQVIVRDLAMVGIGLGLRWAGRRV
jgi:hypothetical protein